MKIALVINPGSGRKFHVDQITEIKSKVLINHDLTEFIAENDSELDVVGNSIQEGYDLVIVCGGDGTVSRIANCLINKPTPMLVIPIGSGNDFANHFGMQSDVESLKRAINDFRTKTINTIQINRESRNCLTIVCFAFEAKVNRVASRLPRFIGSAKYTIATFIALLGKSYEKLRIDSDAVSEINSYSLGIIANTPSFGGGMKVSNKADATGDNLYLILVNRVNKIKLIYLFLLLLAGKHYDRTEFRQYAARNIKIESVESKVRAQADGDSLPSGDFEAKLNRNSLIILETN